MKRTNEHEAPAIPLAQEEFLTGRQVATKFKLCRHTIRRWELRGLLKPLRFNSRVLRYPRSQVERLLKEVA